MTRDLDDEIECALNTVIVQFGLAGASREVVVNALQKAADKCRTGEWFGYSVPPPPAAPPNTRLDDHLTDEETTVRLAEIDRLAAPLHRERPWQSMLGLIGSGVLALLTVLAFVVMS